MARTMTGANALFSSASIVNMLINGLLFTMRSSNDDAYSFITSSSLADIAGNAAAPPLPTDILATLLELLSLIRKHGYYRIQPYKQNKDNNIKDWRKLMKTKYKTLVKTFFTY